MITMSRDVSRRTRKRRMARAVNERIVAASEPLPAATHAEFVCECADADCFAAVAMTLAERDAATADEGYFVVRPAHLARGELAVVATSRYAVVRPARRGESVDRVPDAPRSR